jgi:hypothetical protein
MPTPNELKELRREAEDRARKTTALLHAAAPDMLAALKSVLAAIELTAGKPTECYLAVNQPHRLEALRKAIAKAEGRAP